MRFSPVIRRQVWWPLLFSLALLLLPTWCWGKLQVTVLRPTLTYPSQSAPWLEPFLQFELTRQLQLSGQFAVMPPEIVELWQPRLKQNLQATLTEMQVEVGVSLSLQKVLGQAVATWQVLQHNGQEWTVQEWTQTLSWTDPAGVVDELLQGMGRSTIFAELDPWPPSYSWEGTEAFFRWRAQLTQIPPDTLDTRLTELDALESSYPELQQWIAYHRAMLLVLKATVRRPAHVPTLREAEDALKPAMELQPGASEQHALMALILHLKGEKPLAKSEAVQANATNPRLGPALILYGLTVGQRPQDGQNYIVSGLTHYPFLKEASPRDLPPYHVLAPELERWLVPSEDSGEQEDYATLMREGEAQYQAGEWTRAERYFKRAQQLEPDRPESPVFLARLRIAQEDLAGSLKLLDPLRKRFPNEPQVLLYYGYTLEKLGEMEAAENAYRDSLRNSPDNSRALLRLGTVLIKRGRLEEARSFLESLTRKYPTYTVAWWNLGITYHQLNELRLAEEAWSQALALEPNNLKIQRTLERVQQEIARSR